jgi:hypothetical protein
MAYTPTDPSKDLTTSATIDTEHSGYSYASDDPDTQSTSSERPRLIEEHQILGPHGQDELEATDDRGRRWYHLRPDPRRRADLIGFNYTWWLIWIFVIFVILLPWGRGWGY